MTVILSNFLIAQGDSSIISDARVYSKYIDSVSRLDYPQGSGFMTSIADGIIKRDEITIGGFGVYTLSNAKGDTALRIEYHDNIDVNIYKVYYYKLNILIYATVELKENRGEMKRIYWKEEVYNADGIVTGTINEKTKKANRYFEKTNFSLYADGIKFLKDFKDNNRR